MITYLIPILLGWLCGVLVNYLADILPLRRRLTKPFCIQCDNNQELGNYFIWPRRCPTCNYPRTVRTWFVEIFFIAASVYVFFNEPYKLGYLTGMVLLVYFGVVVLIDLEYRLIMHPVSIIGAILGLVIGIMRVGIIKSVIGGAVGFGLMWLLYLLGVLLIKLVDRARGRPVNDVALGFGDVNLSGVLGLILGWPQIILGLVTAVIVGGIVSLIYIIIKLLAKKYEAFMALPYGPFLVLGAVIIIYFSDVVLRMMGN